MTETWVRTDEALDVVGSIRHALRTAKFVKQDQQAWKWVALALHSALQGSCVCHLTTSATPLGAVTTANARQWVQYFEDSRRDPSVPRPKTLLMSLPDLLKAARKPNSAGDGSTGSEVTLIDADLEWLRRFHDTIRNQFTHFEPMGWSIEVSGLPDLAKLISRLIGRMLDVGYAFRHLDEVGKEDLRLNLSALAANDWLT